MLAVGGSALIIYRSGPQVVIISTIYSKKEKGVLGDRIYAPPLILATVSELSSLLPGRRVGERDGAQCGKLESSEAVARIRGGAYILSPSTPTHV